MTINYDRKVLELARKVASQEGAVQWDLAKFLFDEHVLGWRHPDGSFATVSYISPETKKEIHTLMKTLPRRQHNKKY